MAEEQLQEGKKRSASERINDLEVGVSGLFQLTDNMTRDLMAMREALKLLNEKVNAMTKAQVNGELMTNEVLDRLVMESRVDELTEKLNVLVKSGLLVAEEVVTTQSFVVGRELDKDDNVTNPRLQFAFLAIKKENQDKILGAKVGDLIPISDNVRFNLLESYKIVPPTAPDAAPSDAVPATETSSSESAPAAPATEQAPGDQPSQGNPTPTQSN